MTRCSLWALLSTLEQAQPRLPALTASGQDVRSGPTQRAGITLFVRDANPATDLLAFRATTPGPDVGPTYIRDAAAQSYRH